MQQEGALVDWISPRTLARRIAAQLFVTTLFWTQGYLDDESLRRIMLQGAYLNILGVSTSPTTEDIQERLRLVLP